MAVCRVSSQCEHHHHHSLNVLDMSDAFIMDKVKVNDGPELMWSMAWLGRESQRNVRADWAINKGNSSFLSRKTPIEIPL
jgi:hypothetical protein